MIKLRKIRFLTLIHRDGSDVAEIVNGYTDGAYNFYKDKYGRWFTILPDYGMSINMAYRLKDARAAADVQYVRMINRVNPEYLETARERFLKAARIAATIDQ